MFLRRKELRVRPSWQEVRHDVSAKIYWTYWDALILREGVLFKKWESPNFRSEIFQIVVPRNFIKQIMEEAHDSVSGGHFGVNKTLGKIRRRFYWATCKNDVEDWCRSCRVCVAKKDPSGKGRSMQVYDSGSPFERVQMDILGPLPMSTTGNRYLLLVIDCFTKWVEAFPLKNIKATTIADVFVKQFISRHGVPLEVHTDQKKKFRIEYFPGNNAPFGN